jgi:hypothetical protein
LERRRRNIFSQVKTGNRAKHHAALAAYSGSTIIAEHKLCDCRKLVAEHHDANDRHSLINHGLPIEVEVR